MVSPVHPEPKSVSPITQAAQVAADPTTAGAAAAANAPVTMKTKVRDLAHLRELDRKWYNKMMESMGMTICRKMQQSQDRIKKLMREGQRR